MFRSTSFRLAAFYTGIFSLSVVLLGAAILLITRQALVAQFDARLKVETEALTRAFQAEGFEGLVEAVRERDQTPGGLDYGLAGPGHRPIAGVLGRVDAGPGWSTLTLTEVNEAPERLRLLTTRLPGGYRLMIGDDLARVEEINQAVAVAFGWALLGVILIGVLGGLGLSRDVRRRLAAITDTAEAIIDGDLKSRVPVRGSDDDLDRLASTFNRMLDRIGALLESLRQVSNDVAHDLKTPLTRLRQRLESMIQMESDEERSEGLQLAQQELDGILDTFAALLRIAQIEAGARRPGFHPVDLADVAATVVEAFAPSAEENGQTLVLGGELRVIVNGDRELLVQLLVNLVENALRHCPGGVAIEVSVFRDPAGAPILKVEDNGPGVPRSEHPRIFDRFYRLERSRTSPGSGLGLTLVASIARLHAAETVLYDALPGLGIKIIFPVGP